MKVVKTKVRFTIKIISGIKKSIFVEALEIEF